MRYRIGNHNPALVYGEHDAAESFTPRPKPEMIAVFVRREDGEHELDALHYVRAMNATMPSCTCRVVCCCGALVGTTSGCETCMEHNGECADEVRQLREDLAALLPIGRMYLDALDADPENEMLTLPEALGVTDVREAVERGEA